MAGCASGIPPEERPHALPRIVAHRGGTADAPENTIAAIRQAIDNKADAIWLTVQLSRDQVPVLYRPADLSTLTNASGPVSAYTATELAAVNSGWHYKDKNGRLPYRNAPVGIPTLAQALRAVRPGIPLILDMKALPAAPQVQAVANVLSAENAWSRVTLYSTEAAYQRAFSAYPQARMFESRDATRDRLVRRLLADTCEPPAAMPDWSAFELHREVTVTEKFTLGEGVSKVRATMWTPATVACFRTQARVHIMAIAVNSEEDYRLAACLGIDAILADSPAQMRGIRAKTSNNAVLCAP